MVFRIKFSSPVLVLPFLILFIPASAQKLKKTDKLLIANLEAHIHYLSDEKAAGRQAGIPGEKGASDYIASEFSKIGLVPKGDNHGWLQAFDIDQGREVSTDAFFIVGDHTFILNKEYFPLAFSAVATVSGSPAIALQESGVPWFLDLRDLLEAESGNARADLRAAIRAQAETFARKGATALILYNSSATADDLAFDPKDNSAPASIPIIYITAAAKKKYLRDESASLDIRLKTAFTRKKYTDHNVIGYLDNGAATTVLIGARYNYWGDHRAADRDTTSPGVIEADNISGVAAMIELARMLTSSRLKNNNYLFVAFSGGEHACAGSHFLAGHPPVDPQRFNYMLDLDKIVPPQDSAYGMIVGGYGSSPSWWGACREVEDKINFTFHLDSAYSRAGDEASFYAKSIPALVFYTGGDNKEHTIELAIVKYIFDIVKAANTRGRLAFSRG